jgi:hypothetical protein
MESAMKFIAAAIAATALTSFGIIHSAEARCFWNGFDIECHYPAPPRTMYREVYREVEPVYQPPRVIHREVIERAVEGPTVIYHDEW